MFNRLPPLNAVKAFEAAARLGSFVAAADALCVTQPAIGRHIKQLERWLGVPLFDRHPRGVTLTHAGLTYYTAVTAALQQIHDAGHELAARAAERRLRILVVPGFATRWLNRQIDAIMALQPGLRISIEPNATFTEVNAGQADIGIAYGPAHHFPQRVATLAMPAVFPVCSPGWLAAHPAIATAGDLLTRRLIHEDDGWWWTTWFNAVGVKQHVQAQVSYISVDHAIDMAQAGHGVALANGILVQAELADGRLVRPIGQEAVLDGYQLLRPAGVRHPDADWFCGWLRQALRDAFPAACGGDAQARP